MGEYLIASEQGNVKYLICILPNKEYGHHICSSFNKSAIQRFMVKVVYVIQLLNLPQL